MAIHILGLPLKHFWQSMYFITQFGTTGADYSVGTGYLRANRDFYFVPATGVDIDSYFERWLMLPWGGMAFKQEWESACVLSVTQGFSQQYYGWGNNRWADSARVYTYEGLAQYAAFWFVRDATYNKRLLAVTRNGANKTITDILEWSLNVRYKLRIDLEAANKIKYYVDNVLKATHTTPALDFAAGGLYIKLGVSNQNATDERLYAYYLRGRCDY